MKKFTRLVSFCLVLIFALSMHAPALAVVSASDYFALKTATIYAENNGEICVNYNVGTTRIMNMLGASEIQIYESTDDGSSWGSLPVTTLLGSVANEMLTNSTNSYSHLVSYNGVVGYTYKAIITFYAADNSGSSTASFTTSNIKAVK